MASWKEYMAQQDSYAAQFPQHINNLIRDCDEHGEEHIWKQHNKYEDVCDRCALLRDREERFLGSGS